MLMEESFIPSSKFEVASNTVNKILRQPVEEIEITEILPRFNDMLIQIKCLTFGFM